MTTPQRYHLDNGLKVIAYPHHTAPVVAMAMWVQAGSADERPGEEGLAHVHEHMLFKGTARRGVGEIAREIEACGGSINAFTSFDNTVYHLTVASRFFDQGLDVLCDAIKDSAFDAQELDKELEVILEELKRGQDQPSRVRMEKLFELAYTQHPYKRPVIGTAESISALTRQDVTNFYKRWYNPANMTLVVVGDISPERMKEAIEAQLGSMEPSEPIPRERVAEPVQKEPRVALGHAPTQEILTAMAFHVPGVGHEDGPTLDVLRLLLAYGDSSRLVARLERGLQWVNDVNAGAYMPRDPGIFMLTTDHMPHEDHPGVGPLLKTTLAELRSMAHTPPSREKVLRARTLLESSQVHQRQTMEGMAMVLGSYEVVAGGLDKEALYYQRLRQVTPESIADLVRRVFVPEHLSLVVTGPKEAIDAMDAQALLEQACEGLRDDTAAQSASHTSLPRDKDRIVRLKLGEDGPTLLVQEDSSVGLVSMRALFLGGARHEPVQHPGLGHMTSCLWTRGTQSRSLDEIAREVESMGSGMDAYSGRNSMGIQMEVLASHFGRGLSLMADCLDNPVFDAELMDVERRLTQESLRARADSLGATTALLFRKALYGDHPYAQDILGTPQSVAQMQREDILNFYRPLIQPDKMVLSVVGDVRAEEVAQAVAQRFAGGVSFAGGTNNAQADAPLALPAAKRRFLATTLPNKQQANIILGFRSVDLHNPDRYPLDVISAVLSGQGGRLFMELRDKQSLAYSVFSQFMIGLDPGSFTLHITTSPEKIGQAVRGMVEQIERLQNEDISTQEIERAKLYIAGNHDIQLQSFGARAMQMGLDELYGMSYRHHRDINEHILAVTKEQMRDVCQRRFDFSQVVLTIVHPEGTQLPDLSDLDLPDPEIIGQ
mgnify:CR=1 FL=1